MLDYFEVKLDSISTANLIDVDAYDLATCPLISDHRYYLAFSRHD